MYAHQVIEEFSSIRLYEPVINDAVSIIAKIKKSVHFFFGDVDFLFDLMPNSLIDFSPNPYDVMLNGGSPYKAINSPPYRSCTFSMYGGGKKLLYLIEERSDDPATILVRPVRFHKEERVWLPSMAEFEIDLITDNLKILPIKYFNDGSERYYKEMEKTSEIDGTLMVLVKTCLTLLNTKNITTIDNPPPEKLNKKRAKSGKCPLFTYKTLVIKPTGKKQAQNEAQGLWETRVHLCRGHFKTYTEENPLFGRLTGRYWWQPSVRGNKKKGVVMKDYKVVAA